MSRVTVHRKLSQDGVSTARPEEAAGDFALTWIGNRTGPGERRQVVVLACGFADPPTAQANDDPEVLADMLAPRAKAVAEIVARGGGVMIAIGIDRLLACWGWPTCRDGDGRRAVAAALDIVCNLGDLVRCGVDAGIAVTGRPDQAGSGVSVVGGVVRSAQLLQEIAPAGRVTVSATLQPLLADAFVTQPLAGCGVTSPGQGPPSIVVDGIADRQPCTSAIRSGWIGRDSEFSGLLEHWRGVCRGAAAFVLVEGEAGVGKTTLVAMLKEHVAHSGATVIEISCTEAAAGIAQAPLRQLAGNLLALHAASPGHAAGPADDETTLPGSAEQVCDRLSTLVQVATAVRPVAVVIEDVHLADAATLTCLAALTGRLPSSCPVLLLATSRNGLPGELTATGRWRTQELGRLPQAALERILAAAPIAQALPLAARQRIAELAEGIPFYALELAWMQAKAPSSTTDHRILLHPNRLTALIASRLDAVGNLKPLAQVAAVLGRVVDSRVLAALLEMERGTLTIRLDMLCERGILSRLEDEAGAHESGVRYRFAHALLWSVAYGSMLKSHRRALHARAAAELVGRFGELAAAAPAAVAHHFIKAGQPGRSFWWWRGAAVAAAARGAAANAVAHVGEAMAAKAAAPQDCTPLQEAELMSLLGAQMNILGGSATPEILGVYTRALELLSTLPDRPADLDFDIRWGITNIHMVRGDFRSVLASSSLLIDEARETGHDGQLVVALRLNGTAKLLSGRIREAIELLETLSGLYRPETGRQQQFRYMSDQGIIGIAHLAWATAIGGDDIASRAAQRRALQLAGRLGHAHTSAGMLGALAGAAQVRSDAAAAGTLARACLDLSLEHGYEYWAARADLILSWTAAQRDPVQGLDMIRSAGERYRATGSGRAASYADYLEAEIALAAGQPRQAMVALERAQAAGNLQSGKLYAAEFLRQRAEAQVACDPATRPMAEKLLLEARSLAETQGADTFAQRAVLAYAKLTRRRRRLHPAGALAD